MYVQYIHSTLKNCNIYVKIIGEKKKLCVVKEKNKIFTYYETVRFKD